jgi:hypothetical protein
MNIAGVDCAADEVTLMNLGFKKDGMDIFYYYGGVVSVD